MRRALIGIGAAVTLALGYPSAASATGGWTIQPVPMPAGATYGELAAVSCPSATICYAVGSTSNSFASIEFWNGSAWAVQPVPVPAGATNFYLTGISCFAPGTCVAVGSYVDKSGTARMITEHTQRAGPWQAKNILGSGELNAVSCASPTSCTAVGATGPGVTLAEHWTATGGWHQQPTAQSAARKGLYAISCPAAGTCTAAGFSGAPVLSTHQMLAEHE